MMQYPSRAGVALMAGWAAAQMVTIMLYHALIRGSFYTRELVDAGVEQTALGGLLNRDDLRLNFFSGETAVRSIPSCHPPEDCTAQFGVQAADGDPRGIALHSLGFTAARARRAPPQRYPSGIRSRRLSHIHGRLHCTVRV